MVAAASRKSVSKQATNGANEDVQSTHMVRWDKKMSNNCAAALLVYTLMQIFFVLSFINSKGMSIAPYFGLVLLVAIIIPFCRKFEKRWENMDTASFSEQSLAARFRTDQITLWILALGLPFLFVGLIKAVGSIL
ncbi:MAG: hypothetical protein V7676_08880 [Parasphingorhabdus sp.]|uniref:hypothetical protein n=1 Tax=Parasphingorhabdus sp. TaxID=2709688 RepID=UPI0030019FFD